MAANGPRIALFFTWDVSLALWQEKGLLQREIKLYQALAQKGARVTFFSWGGEEDVEIAKALQPDIDTISIYNYIPRPQNQLLRFLVSFWAPFKLRSEIRKVNIIKTNQLWGSWAAVLGKFVAGRPLIARCGFELYDFTIRQGHKAWRRWIIWTISKVSYSAANHICVATQEDKNFVIDHFDQSPSKITIHPNWIDTDFFAPQTAKLKTNTILFVGRLSEQKNLEMLIDALEGSEYTLDLVGQGELKEALEARAKERGVTANFLGPVPNDQLPKIYSSYPVYILPSHYEGNPKTLLEAMACSSAVIGTDVNGIASVIEHEKSGLLCRKTAADIRKAIDRLFTDGDLRRGLGQHARQQIIDNQTLDRLVDKELACYSTIKGQME